MRAEQDAGDDEAENRAKAETLEQHHADSRCRKDDDNGE